ncbi:MAG: TetR/AcrR family transcriptional regulator [Oscillospiraceae bacterium]|nr:TetR/AcrR family transcriptional regulator [Oscillospiraceae bacterium]
MPKVTDEYIADRKNFIIKCTGEILREKPLYLITMRDVIKKAGFSQGVIYRYYTNLDEIYVDFINNHTANIFLEQKIDALLSSEEAEKIILAECFIVMGEYIEELMKSVVGKTFFELTVLYAYDFEKRAAIFPKLKFKQSLEYTQHKIVEYILNKVEKGIFQPQIPVRSIILFVSGFIDGIAQSVVIHTTEDDNHNSEAALDIREMFQTLAKAVISFLEV